MLEPATNEPLVVTEPAFQVPVVIVPTVVREVLPASGDAPTVLYEIVTAELPLNDCGLAPPVPLLLTVSALVVETVPEIAENGIVVLAVTADEPLPYRYPVSELRMGACVIVVTPVLLIQNVFVPPLYVHTSNKSAIWLDEYPYKTNGALEVLNAVSVTGLMMLLPSV